MLIKRCDYIGCDYIEVRLYKKIIDNAIVIFLENGECWDNYYKRENKKTDKGHKTSYDMLDEKEYKSMVKSFKENQNIYENTEKYKEVEIRNDKESWKKIYNAILDLSNNE